MRPRRWLALLFFAALIATGPALAPADDSSFQFETGNPQPYTPGYLGNGAIGLETTPLGTSAAHSLLAGVYDHTPGDVPRIAAAPAWNEVDIYNGSHWLNAGNFDGIQNYHQLLDMYDGVLRTSYVWFQDNRKMRVEAEEFVSRARAEAAATRVVITPEFSGHIQVRLPLRNWPAPRRYLLERIEKLDPEAQKNPWLIWYPGHLDVTSVRVNASSNAALLSLAARAPGTGPEIAESVTAEWSSKASVQTRKQSDGVEAVLTLQVRPDVSYTFTKCASIVVGARPTAQQTDWRTLLEESAAAWHNLWESDIVVEGDPRLQRTIHSMLFYLLAGAREGLDVSIPPMGLSTAGYYGHIFWDADTFMFPSLLILHPELARPLVAFRSRTREVARDNARQNGFQGAMYPWEAGPDGAETTPRFAGQNAKYENHINGDVALASWQYWLATGDRTWLQQDAWPILRDTADFWVSRVIFNAKLKRYEIGKVVAVNESLIGVSNDAYTNGVAKKNLDLAIAAAQAMHVEPHARWRDVSAKMYIPESDSPLLRFPLDFPSSPQQIRAAVNSMMLRIQRGETGGMMGTEFYPILAAEIGDRAAIGKMIEPLSAPYLRPPFQAIAETPRNQNISFITGAGAFLQQFLFGYSGLRFSETVGIERKFPPILPPNVQRITLKNITIRGKRATLVFDSASR